VFNQDRQNLWMTHVRTLDKLWIDFRSSQSKNSIHRNSPSSRPTYTGGFSHVFIINFNNLTYFYMKSGSTITTKL